MSFKVFWAVVVGTVLEYFDFLLFAHFSFILAPLFFPDIDPIISAIQTLGLFAVGFLMRPLGAIIFGRIGDYKGRKHALSASILCSALPTLIVCFLPSYNIIGVAAPLILIFCRMTQGLSLGGEYINAGIFLMEHTPSAKRGLYSCVLCVSATVGCILALICAFVILYFDTPLWVWRIPFFLGSVAGLISYKMRKILVESPEFLKFQKHHHAVNFSWKQTLKDKKPFFIIIAVGALFGVLIWTPITYTNFYITRILEWRAKDAVFMTLLANMTFGITALIAGIFSNRQKPQTIMLRTALIASLLTYPLFLCLTHGYIALTQIGFSVLAGFFTAPIHRLMLDLYPVHKRCQAISFGFSLGAAIFGGPSPMISAWLVDVTNDHSAPAIYVFITSLMAAWALYLYPSAKISSVKNRILTNTQPKMN